MASDDLALIRVVDFVSKSTPIVPNIHNKTKERSLKATAAYALCQTVHNTQTLISSSNPLATSYTFVFSLGGGFKRQRPHIMITKNEKGHDRRLAEVRIASHGDAMITFAADRDPLTLVKKGQSYHYSYYDGLQIWRPLGPSSAVLELTSGHGSRVALFVYPESELSPKRSASMPAMRKGVAVEEKGSVHVIDEGMEGMGLEVMLVTAVVVVARMKGVVG
ncbi:hypothetical protein MMC21_007266 [Puttea exsequens]|nr:hypothetical protein [Puttea exsequens]